MRTFSCHLSGPRGGPMATILAANPARAQVIARREILEAHGVSEIELRENGRPVAVITG